MTPALDRCDFLLFCVKWWFIQDFWFIHQVTLPKSLPSLCSLITAILHDSFHPTWLIKHFFKNLNMRLTISFHIVSSTTISSSVYGPQHPVMRQAHRGQFPLCRENNECATVGYCTWVVSTTISLMCLKKKLHPVFPRQHQSGLRAKPMLL